MSLFGTGYRLIKKSAKVAVKTAKVGIKVIKVASKIGKVPVLGTVIRMTPIGSGLMAGATIANSLMDKKKEQNKMASGLSAPSGFKLTPLSGVSNIAARTSSDGVVTTTTTTTSGGAMSLRRGSAAELGALTGPQLEAMSAAGERIPFVRLKKYPRSPRGYVIVNYGGVTHCLRKDIARRYGWRPPHKPPVSVGEYQAIKKACRAVDKFHKIEKAAAALMHFKHRISGGHSHQKQIKNIIIERKGKC